MQRNSSDKCVFCNSTIQDNDPVVCFQFEGTKAITYHENCYKAYIEQFNRFRKAVKKINSGEFNKILDKESKNDIKPVCVPDQQEENCICPICLYNVADMVLLPCYHRLCSECLLDWRRKTVSKKQPGTKCCFCRRYIDKSVPYATLKQEQQTA